MNHEFKFLDCRPRCLVLEKGQHALLTPAFVSTVENGSIPFFFFLFKYIHIYIYMELQKGKRWKGIWNKDITCLGKRILVS